jgi:hypothetical protein
MKINVIICLFFSSLTLAFVGNPVQNIADGKYIKIDSCIYVKFKGKPERCFYQTPLGDVTTFEYKPASEAGDSNILYSVALYKETQGTISDSNQLIKAINLKFISLVNTEETGITNLNGKILYKDEAVQDSKKVIKFEVLFTNLSEFDQIEGEKDVIYSARYIKCKDAVLKLWTYTKSNKKNKMIDDFFNTLRFNKQ